jgi:hypothetical protein
VTTCWSIRQFAVAEDHGYPSGTAVEVNGVPGAIAEIAARGIRRSGRIALWCVHTPMKRSDLIESEIKS